MKWSLEGASRLAVTGLLANSHLIQETTPETVLEGWRLAAEVSKEADLPVRCVAVMNDIHEADGADLSEIQAPLLRMQRYMLPPWLQAEPEGEDAPLPAARSIPIGKPQAHPLPRVDGVRPKAERPRDHGDR